MNDRKDNAGAQFHADRPTEQEAVRTTIVGGRPPGSGQGLSGVPRGIEVLLKKASVDPTFKDLLLARRAEAAEVIGLKLDPVEANMLQTAPASQLEAIIAQTHVPDVYRRAFLGAAAGAMLAVLTGGCKPDPDPPPVVKGILPGPPPPPKDTPTPSPEEIERQVKRAVAVRFNVEVADVKRETRLVEDLKADDLQLAGLRRQLEKDYNIKLAGKDFFDKVKTVGDLIDAVVTAVKERPPTKPDPDQPQPPPIVKGIRPDPPPSRGIDPN